MTASPSGGGVALTAKVVGSISNYSLSAGSSTTSGSFANSSFPVSVSGAALTGGADPSPGSLATPAVTQYAYDALDNLTCVVQKGTDTAAFTSCAAAPAAWRPRSFTYNSLSQLLTATNPESGTISYAYDSDGNLLTKTDARGITTTHAYDALHRLTGKTYSNGDPAIGYFYDQPTYSGLTITNGIGRRTGMSDAAGAEAWSFDAMGRVVANRRTTNGVTNVFSYQYNLDGSLWKLTYPSGRIITYSYNPAARLTAAQDVANGINYATAASYTPGGAFASVNNSASIVSTYFYNNRLQPCRISVKNSGTAPANCTDGTNIGNVLDFTYGFADGLGRNNGNVVSIANNRDTNRSQSFTYDELNRIKTAQSQATSGAHDWGLSFGYDIWANLLSATITKGNDVPMLSQSVGTNNRLSGYSYDAAGNMLSDGSYSYTWDAEARMKTGAGVTYTYDGDGRRVKKSSGKLYWYGMSGLDPLLETDLSGNATTDFMFFNGKRTARRESGGSVFYYFATHLGSANVITNAAGGIVEESDYYPFGGERVVVNNDPNAYKFTGKERDAESGCDYFGARYYCSSFGRFLTPDWSETPQPVPYADFNNPQTLKLYAYVANNPLNSTDPDGHCPDFLSCVTQVVVGAAQGTANFVTNTVAGVLTPARLANGELATNPSEVNQAIAEGIAGSIVTAATDYASGQAVESFTSLDAQGQMTVVTEGVLAGASVVAAGARGGVQGSVYKTVEQPGSGMPYIGRTIKTVEERMATRSDGRVGPAKKIDSFNAKDPLHGQYKEQKAIDAAGGVKNLDNRRNEVNPKRMEELKKKYERQ